MLRPKKTLWLYTVSGNIPNPSGHPPDIERHVSSRFVFKSREWIGFKRDVQNHLK